MWDIETGTVKRPMLIPDGFIHIIAFSPDGKTLASVDRVGGVVKLWDVATGKYIRTLMDHPGGVGSVAFSPDGKTLASGIGKAVKLWDMATGKLIHTLTGNRFYVGSVAFSPDGKTIAGGSYGGVKLWDVETGELKRTLLTGSSPVAFSPDGRTLASGAGDKTVTLWDVATTVTLWDVATGKPIRTLAGNRSYVESVAFSSDGKTLAMGSFDFLQWVRARAAGKSRDGKTLVTTRGFPEGTVTLWDVETGELKRTLTGCMRSVAFSPDGKTLVSGLPDGTMKLWDVETGELKRTLTGQNGGVMSVAFSPDGKTIIAGGSFRGVKLWDVETGELKRTLLTGSSPVVFSPDGKTVATGLGGTVQFWDPSGGRHLATLMFLPSRGGETVSTDYLVLTPEGYYDGSAGAGRFINWRVGSDLVSVEAYENVFHRPQLVRQALRGEVVPSSEQQVQRFLAGQLLPPQVTFTFPQGGQEVTGDQVRVEVMASDDRDVTQMELLVNGRPVAAKPIRGEAKHIPTSHRIQRTFQALVPLPPGEKTVTLKAIAYDDEELKGWTPEIRLRRNTPPVIGDLYVFSVGVSQYQNPKYNLKYAARDADAFAALWKQTEGTLYRRVVPGRLTDAQATAANVRDALVKLAQTATSSDSVVLFLSDHGVQVNEKDFYFATHEIDASTPTRVAETALPWTVFQDTLSQMKAKRVVLFLDACHSGNSLGGQQANSDWLAGLLVRRGGAMVFASSRGSEFSYELLDKQHGAFTVALVEGIGEGKADLDIGGRDGMITPNELLNYLEGRVRELTGNLQTPTCPLMRDFGEPFPLARVK